MVFPAPGGPETNVTRCRAARSSRACTRRRARTGKPGCGIRSLPGRNAGAGSGRPRPQRFRPKRVTIRYQGAARGRAPAAEVFAALQTANTELGVTVLVVTHDPAVSAQVRIGVWLDRPGGLPGAPPAGDP